MKSRNEKETVPVPSAALEMIHCSFFQPEKKKCNHQHKHFSRYCMSTLLHNMHSFISIQMRKINFKQMEDLVN